MSAMNAFNISRFTVLLIHAISWCFIGLVGGIYIGWTQGLPFVEKQDQWSIGIFFGESPFHVADPGKGPDGTTPLNPVLTAKDVTDVQARFVADPFIIQDGQNWYMFFEVLNSATQQGDIGVAVSQDGRKWTYQQIVLDERFHLSYPYVFRWGDDYFMLPESHRANALRLYKAVHFPTQWTLVGKLHDGEYIDPSIFRHNDKWWLFASNNPHKNDTLRLYYADELLGPWIEHPKSPIIEYNPHIARPGGRVLLFDNRIFRYTQDDAPYYGKQLRAFEVTELTTTSYQEKEVDFNPILKGSGSGWNAKGMHQVDPHPLGNNQWIAAVDGHREVTVIGFRRRSLRS